MRAGGGRRILSSMTSDERDELVEELLARLWKLGVPEGDWLLDITTVRRQLRLSWEAADDLLTRLQEALMAKHEAHR